MRRISLSRAICALVCLLSASCVNQDSAPATSTQAPSMTASGATATPPLQSSPASARPLEAQLPPDTYVTYIAPRSDYLPRWKTEWEREVERMGSATGPGGLVTADQFDDYRNTNIDRFYITQPPTTAGIRTPAEFEASQAYLLKWEKYTDAAWIKYFGEIVKGAWGVVPVLMMVNDAAHRTWVEGQLSALGYTTAEMQDPKNIIWWEHKSDAFWARDFGPVSIVDAPVSGQPTVAFVDFRYYHTRPHDDEVPHELAKEWGVTNFRPDLEYEGGNFMSTSDGLCMATKGVLYYNLQLSQSAVEQVFSDYLGCKQTVFPATMKGGVIAHIDMYAKLASDTSVLVGEYLQSQDPTNKAVLDANAQLLDGMTTPSGKTLTVTRIAMPNNKGFLGMPLWRTYTNSLSLVGPGGGKVVLIPVYGGETSREAEALASYAKVYPGWTLVPIDSGVIISGQGAIHCVTMQIPAGTLAQLESAPAPLCGATSASCTTKACGSVSATGCCDGQLLKYCGMNALQSFDCSSDQSCGWDSAKGRYACGTSGNADPSGTYPMSCNVVADAAVPDQGPADGATADQGSADAAPDLALDLALDVSPVTPDVDLVQDGGPAADAGGEEVSDDEGCGCHLAQVPGDQAPAPLVVLLGLAGLLALVRRRR